MIPPIRNFLRKALESLEFPKSVTQVKCPVSFYKISPNEQTGFRANKVIHLTPAEIKIQADKNFQRKVREILQNTPKK
ncbi:MAG: hypothetical protein JSS32_09935 [Verrucomicrobia bacterium]|nr:hypothetical protein [Verrucomicrobiota bacterium]